MAMKNGVVVDSSIINTAGSPSKRRPQPTSAANEPELKPPPLEEDLPSSSPFKANKGATLPVSATITARQNPSKKRPQPTTAASSKSELKPSTPPQPVEQDCPSSPFEVKSSLPATLLVPTTTLSNPPQLNASKKRPQPTSTKPRTISASENDGPSPSKGKGTLPASSATNALNVHQSSAFSGAMPKLPSSPSNKNQTTQQQQKPPALFPAVLLSAVTLIVTMNLYHASGLSAQHLIPEAATKTDEQLLNPLYHHETYNPLHRPFPRWSDGGINIHQLLGFAKGMVLENASTLVRVRLRRDMPELLYIVDDRGLWVSRPARDRTISKLKYGRIVDTERIAALAVNIIINATRRSELADLLARQQSTNGDDSIDQDDDSTIETMDYDYHLDEHPSTRWPRLWRALQPATNTTGGGFPFIMWYGDYAGCNQGNWNGSISIPLFTTCGKLTCDYAFPFPTYKTIQAAQPTPKAWNPVFSNYSRHYPIESKLRKLVWRGGLTGLYEPTNPRVRIGKFAARHLHDESLDIGLVGVAQRNHKFEIDMHDLGGLVDGIFPMEDFQKYYAILDLDGNSWSSRFGSLLCYNSVILKVEPQFVDSFHFQGMLKPWKQYVPVRYDLSDLLEKARYVLDPANQDSMERIIANANHWCQHALHPTAIALDMLDIWERYVEYLDRFDNNWTELWLREKRKMRRKTSPFGFVRRHVGE